MSDAGEFPVTRRGRLTRTPSEWLSRLAAQLSASSLCGFLSGTPNPSTGRTRPE
jgi:hypothetical protein